MRRRPFDIAATQRDCPVADAPPPTDEERAAFVEEILRPKDPAVLARLKEYQARYGAGLEPLADEGERRERLRTLLENIRERQAKEALELE
jgi:hypothetical protein